MNRFATIHISLALLFGFLTALSIHRGNAPKAAFDGFFMSTNLHWGIDEWGSEQ